jgi:predicted MFS family arabinose efflux permease
MLKSTKSKPSTRWWVLGSFSLVAGLSQLLWLNFAPLISDLQSRYGVSEDQAGLLLLVFPLIYILLSIPSGIWIDRKGYISSVRLGAVLMAVFACLRMVPGSFTLLLIAQIGIAVAQPFVVNAVSKLVLDWFEPEQIALCDGIATVGMFLGMALGLAATPLAVARLGYSGAMAAFAVLSSAVAVAFFVWGKSRDAGGPAIAANTGLGLGELKSMLRSRELLLVFALSFLGLGFFNGLTTWIEPILAPSGINSVQAGFIGAALIVGGIVGAAIIPALSDRYRRRKPFLLLSIVAAALTLYPLCTRSGYDLLLGLGALQGFFFLPAFALLLASCGEIAGEKRAGAATGALMLFGNAGGVVVILAMEGVRAPGAPRPFSPAVNLLAATLVGAMLLAFGLRESHPLSATQV